MHILESIRIAVRSLWANKLRSVLTLLGVVIGISSVIAVVTFVSGINDYVAKKIFNLGADVFIIEKMSQVETNVPLGDEVFRVDVPRTAKPITSDELRHARSGVRED